MRQVAAGLLALILAGCATSGPATDANGNPAATLKQAQELRRADRAEQAAAIVQRALLTTSPGNVALQGELARDLVFSDPARALDVVAQAFDPTAPDPKLLMIGGIANDLLGRHADAQKLYADALKITPNDPAILANVEASRRMIAAESAFAAAAAPKRVIAAKPKPAKQVSPIAVAAPDEAPKAATFRERWRLL